MKISFLLTLVALLFIPQTDAWAQSTIRDEIRDRAKNTVVKLREKQESKSSETITLSGRTVAIWRPHSIVRQAPLVLFSHGFNGCETQSTFLTQGLADAGFIVVAPRHKDAICGKGMFSKAQESLFKPESWTDQTYADRKDDLMEVLKALKADRKLANRIDFEKIGLLGHSLGGYTVLGLAGGWTKWKVAGIKAVVAFSPYCQPFAKLQTLKEITIPVQYQGGTRDKGITPFVIRENGCYDQTPSPAMFVEFERAGHFSWTDLRKKSHDSMIFYTVAFFERYLLDKEESGLKNPREDVSELRTK